MSSTVSLLAAIGMPDGSTAMLKRFAESSGVPIGALKYYNDHHKLPSGDHLERICRQARLSPDELRLRMGVVDRRLLEALSRHASEVAKLLGPTESRGHQPPLPEPSYQTRWGRLYRGDCVELLTSIGDESVDLVFADPPFNLNKLYPSEINDDLRERAYLAWCEQWLGDCLRVLKPGGSLFVWNLPRWNSALAEFLHERATFRHWITADIKYSLPIGGRLYPSHYSLLYFCKGNKPRVFHPDRMPMEICHHCFGDLRDYGGYKAKMNPGGVSLTDVWFDIPPVRHTKYKKREGANELAIQLLDRVIEMASDENDIVLDPFGGSGTTYAVAEIKKRRWIGMELGPLDVIVERLTDLRAEAARLKSIRDGYNRLFTRASAAERTKRGIWTDETVRATNGSTPPSDKQNELQLG
jgi:site-specific DNA-methyltransferase (adenine-specific)